MIRTIRFGKKAPRIDPRTLRLERYLAPIIPPPPPRVDWSRGFNIDYGMMLNDTLGDCTEAKKGHAVQIWTLCNGRMVTVPDSVVLAAYESGGGYVPGDPSTDNGEDMLTNLTNWRKNGFGGHGLSAFAAIDYSSFALVSQSIYLFGLVDIGFSVPQSAVDQNAKGEIWDVVPDDGGSVGGHDVVIPMFDSATETLTCITWGMRQKMTWAFFQKYVDEAYALLSPNWISSKNLDPSGILWGDLQKDLSVVVA